LILKSSKCRWEVWLKSGTWKIKTRSRHSSAANRTRALKGKRPLPFDLNGSTDTRARTSASLIQDHWTTGPEIRFACGDFLKWTTTQIRWTHRTVHYNYTIRNSRQRLKRRLISANNLIKVARQNVSVMETVNSTAFRIRDTIYRKEIIQ